MSDERMDSKDNHSKDNQPGSATTNGQGFLPSVLSSAWRPSPETLRIAQRLGEEGLARHTKPEVDTAKTDLHGLYVCQRAVERHQDLEGAEHGMHVYGLVIRSDGHRLHSQRLDDAGVPEGLPLRAGDFYDIDPYDPHWTTIPDGVAEAMLLFYVEGEMPDEQPLDEVADFMAMFLEEDLLELDGPPKGRLEMAD